MCPNLLNPVTQRKRPDPIKRTEPIIPNVWAAKKGLVPSTNSISNLSTAISAKIIANRLNKDKWAEKAYRSIVIVNSLIAVA